MQELLLDRAGLPAPGLDPTAMVGDADTLESPTAMPFVNKALMLGGVHHRLWLTRLYQRRMAQMLRAVACSSPPTRRAVAAHSSSSSRGQLCHQQIGAT